MNQMQRSYQQGILPWGLNGFALKWIAMVTMTIDHIGFVLFPQYFFLRIIGRLAFPIYCFLLVEGACHTKNRVKYGVRLFLFALLSELPFNLVHGGSLWDSNDQNVMFTLLFGLLAVWCLQIKYRLLGGAGALLLIFLAEFLRTDYGGGGVVFILVFYVFYGKRLWGSVMFALANIYIYGGPQNYAIAALAPIALYNGKRGPSMKYLFYLFYPLHLLVLYVVKYRL